MRTSKWFSHYQYQETANVNLFCFVHAGGSSGYYSNWANYFDKDINVIPVEYPMRERRYADPMPGTILELAGSLVEENVDFFQDKPVALWGHCMGGLVAYETTKYMEEKYDIVPKFVGISSLVAPEFSQVPDVSKMTDLEFMELVIQSGFIAKEICENEELLQYLLPIARADFAMQGAYVSHQDRSICAPLLLFNGMEDSLKISESQIDAWAQYTSGGIKKYYFSGNHFYINDHLEEVCALLSQALKTDYKK